MITFGFDLETTGLDASSDRIVTIQYRRGGKNSIWKIWDYPGKEAEKKMVLAFLNEWKDIPRKLKDGTGDIFVGFNVARFDIPFFLMRAIKIGVTSDPYWSEKWLWNNIGRYPSYLDLYQLLGDRLMSFATWRKCMVGSFGKITGEEIPDFFEQKKYDIIEQYVNDELVTLERTYEAVTKEPFYQELLKLRERAGQESAHTSKD